MTKLPQVTVAPATYGGWLALCSHCHDWRMWCVTRPPVDEVAAQHRAKCAGKERT